MKRRHAETAGRRSALAGAAVVVAAVLCLAPATGADPALAIGRVSVASGGTQATAGEAGFSSLSADGHVVAFHSTSADLVGGDTNGRRDVFVHDHGTGSTTRVSVASDGMEGNLSSSFPAISDDGRYVAFSSNATNLVAGDTNERRDVFVHDRTTATTIRVSVATGGAQGNDDADVDPSISGDGTVVAFASSADNLVAGDTNARSDIFLHVLATGTTTRVSVGAGGTEAAGGPSANPVLDADASVVAFASTATNLVAGDTNALGDVFVHDLTGATTTRASEGTDGVEGTGASASPAISADGNIVAFESDATNLVAGDTNARSDVFVRDLLAGITTRASVAFDGAQADSFSFFPTLSAAGDRVAFESSATNLVAGDTNARSDVFVRDLGGGTTARVSVAADAGQAAGTSLFPSLSADGSSVAFSSDAANLVPGDTNNAPDVFLAPAVPPEPPPRPPPVQATDVLCANVVAGADPFTDDAGAFEAVIECLAHAGITAGGPGGLPPTRYGPGLVVTRGQMASFIARELDTANDLETGTGVGELAAFDGSNAFSDVATANVHLEPINRLARAGIALGGPGGRPATEFGPDLAVTRAQMASFINRGHTLLTATPLATSSNYFTDDEGDPHEANINGIASEGIAVGDGVHTYGPALDITRGQMAAFLVRHLAVLEEAGAITPVP